MTTMKIVLLDDHSTDGTSQIAKRAANGSTRLRVVNSKPLPAGWAGKNWACHQLSQNASGQLLIFTDADVQWTPDALSAVVDLSKSVRADLLTVWPTQRTETWTERLVVPLMAFVTLGYLPHVAVNRLRYPALAAANGQCMVFRSEAYRQVGGHAAIRNAIVEDICLARKIKAHGLRLRMADGRGLVACRMYSEWRHVKNGYAKNIIAGYGDSLLGLLAGTLFHWAVFLLPYLWMVYFAVTGNITYLIWSLALVVMAILVRAITAATTRQRPQDALLLSISVILMTVIAAQATWWYLRYGGPRWKGRTIVRNPATRL